MTTPDPIVQFIRDRLNEDEQLADEHHLGQCTVWTEGWRLQPGPCNCYGPAGVLRGVQAKRRIVDLYEATPDQWKTAIAKAQQSSSRADTREVTKAASRHIALLDTLRLLASEWSTHGDYQEEWTP